MAGPEVVVSFDSKGAAEVKRELSVTDKQLAKLDKQLARMQERKLFEELKSRSEAWQKALEGNKRAVAGVNSELTKTQSIVGKLGRGANAFNEIFDAGGKILGTAKALFEFGKAGAQAAAVADAFERLGAQVPSIERLRLATAGVVDDTSLQGYAKLASDLGLTADEMAGLAQRATSLAAETGQLANTSDILTQLLKGEAEGLRNLGVAIDLSAERFKGMTEVQKKLAIAQELAAEGSQAQVDAIDSADKAFAETQATMENLLSDLQVLFAEFLVGSGLLEHLIAIVKGLKTSFEFIAPVMKPILSVFSAIVETGGLMIPFFQAMEAAVKGAIHVLERLAQIMGLDVGRSVVDVTEKTVAKLRDLEKTHYAAADAALEQARALGVLANKLGAEAIDTEKIGALVELANSSTGARTLAQSMLEAGGSFKDAGIALGELEDRLDSMNKAAKKEGGEVIGETYQELRDLVQDTADELARMEEASKRSTKATRSNSDATRDGAAASWELLDSLQTVVAQAGVLSDELIVRGFGEIDTSRDKIISLGSSIVDAIYEPGEAWATSGGLLSRLFGTQEPEEVPTLLEQIASAFDGIAESAQGAWESIGASVGAVEDWGAKASVATQVGSDLAKAFAGTADASTKVDAGIEASGRLTRAFVEDTTAEAALMVLVEAARAGTAFVSGNIPKGIGHTANAASWAAAAAFSVGGSGGAGAGGGGGAGSQRQTSAAEVFEEPAATGPGFSGSVTFNIQSINPNTAGEAVVDALNAFAEAGGGGVISSELLGNAQGRAGI